MSFPQSKDFADDLSDLMDEVPENEIPDDTDDSEQNDDITLEDGDGDFTLSFGEDTEEGEDNNQQNATIQTK